MANKDQSDFMLEEYRQIANAFFNLYVQINTILKLYLTIISISSTAIISILTLRPDLFSDNLSLLEGHSIGQIAGGGFFILSLVGITIFANIIGTRVQMLNYARTINCIRGYFADNYSDIKKYLRLPTDDKTPSYFENIYRSFFWQIFMVSFLNSILITVGLNLFFWEMKSDVVINIIIIILFISIQIIVYYLFCAKRQKDYALKWAKDKK